MAEERPKPRYGEYATPQTQAEAVADSMPPVSPLLAARPAAAADPAAPGAVSEPQRNAGVVVPPAAGTDAAGSTESKTQADNSVEKSSDGSWWASTNSAASVQSRPRKRWDLILTVALLAYGALNVASQVSQYSDITGFLNRMAELYPVFGTGTFVPTGREAAVGLGINVVNFALYLGTLLLSIRRLRQRKLSFFIPLIGGALAAITAAILLSSILASSPGFVGAVTGV